MKAYFYNKKNNRVYVADRDSYIKYNPNVTKIGLCFGYNVQEIGKRIKRRGNGLILAKLIMSEDICPF